MAFPSAIESEIPIMPSLQKPRKITVQGDDGAFYSFLCKPKDDLRKDARLMDFNAIINKMLKRNSESRRRQLRMSSRVPGGLSSLSDMQGGRFP